MCEQCEHWEGGSDEQTIPGLQEFISQWRPKVIVYRSDIHRHWEYKAKSAKSTCYSFYLESSSLPPLPGIIHSSEKLSVSWFPPVIITVWPSTLHEMWVFKEEWLCISVSSEFLTVPGTQKVLIIGLFNFVLSEGVSECTLVTKGKADCFCLRGIWKIALRRYHSLSLQE